MHARIQIYWCTSSIFRHLKLELLTQFPASNDEKYINVVYIWRKFVSFYGYVHWRMTTEISVTYGSEKVNKMNGVLGHLCAHRINYVRRTSWGWWDEWGNTALQIEYLKFEPWRSEAEHTTSRSRMLPTILHVHERAGKKIFFLNLNARVGFEPAIFDFLNRQP